ncbi:hypothetical protein [Aquimarina brevivitae]|uniref:Uncharacterized protein n=1 Tax=Aquimarina brevivitae TaxID=323412 RepID=A0A4Q7P1T9_9FLAO|nr:hypothetical protein [Aquimarina brevivitae]RZS93826.1 hypothetical protein EV197_2407 [Aquimarina brevivitae]
MEEKRAGTPKETTAPTQQDNNPINLNVINNNIFSDKKDSMPKAYNLGL